MGLGRSQFRTAKNNTTGHFIFAQVYTPLFRGEQIIHPIGKCREMSIAGTPCEHKTENEAEECFRVWEENKILVTQKEADILKDKLAKLEIDLELKPDRAYEIEPTILYLKNYIDTLETGLKTIVHPANQEKYL